MAGWSIKESYFCKANKQKVLSNSEINLNPLFASHLKAKITTPQVSPFKASPYFSCLRYECQKKVMLMKCVVTGCVHLQYFKEHSNNNHINI